MTQKNAIISFYLPVSRQVADKLSATTRDMCWILETNRTVGDRPCAPVGKPLKQRLTFSAERDDWWQWWGG
jgi:hypothetical protein